ncbi:ABC transporter permease [Alsobacter metallidurans]|uniref:ABC transporter permease n=1 Tax=Alsobacter metallidurans TaxID=340221 RepID=UPI001FCEDADD|nr:ABC transporter permease [Alsobacter metallidurans]
MTTPRSAVRARRTARPWLLGFVLPVGLALGWELAVRLGLAQGRLMPPPSKILEAFWSLARTGELWVHVGATLGRVLAGFAFGALFGTLLGAFAGASERFRWIFDPTLQALRAVPSIAWVPLFLLWFGIFETSKIILIAVGVFFPVYLGVAGAIAGIDRKLLEVGRVFRLSPFATVRRVMLPAVLPEWIIAIRSGLGLGFMFVVAAELMGASEGLGYLLLDGQQMGRPDQILAAIIAFALLGKVCDGIVVAATAPLTAWQDLRRGRL